MILEPPSGWTNSTAAIGSNGLDTSAAAKGGQLRGDREEQTDGFGGAVDGTWMIAPR
jgi:hypothetical protein